jgi:hypothetical protein
MVFRYASLLNTAVDRHVRILSSIEVAEPLRQSTRSEVVAGRGKIR